MEASIRSVIGIWNGLLLGWLSLTVILLAAACGIVSAVYWARASMIQPDTLARIIREPRRVSSDQPSQEDVDQTDAPIASVARRR